MSTSLLGREKTTPRSKCAPCRKCVSLSVLLSLFMIVMVAIYGGTFLGAYTEHMSKFIVLRTVETNAIALRTGSTIMESTLNGVVAAATKAKANTVSLLQTYPALVAPSRNSPSHKYNMSLTTLRLSELVDFQIDLFHTLQRFMTGLPVSSGLVDVYSRNRWRAALVPLIRTFKGEFVIGGGLGMRSTSALVTEEHFVLEIWVPYLKTQQRGDMFLLRNCRYLKDGTYILKEYYIDDEKSEAEFKDERRYPGPRPATLNGLTPEQLESYCRAFIPRIIRRNINTLETRDVTAQYAESVPQFITNGGRITARVIDLAFPPAPTMRNDMQIFLNSDMFEGFVDISTREPVDAASVLDQLNAHERWTREFLVPNGGTTPHLGYALPILPLAFNSTTDGLPTSAVVLAWVGVHVNLDAVADILSRANAKPTRNSKMYIINSLGSIVAGGHEDGADGTKQSAVTVPIVWPRYVSLRDPPLIHRCLNFSGVNRESAIRTNNGLPSYQANFVELLCYDNVQLNRPASDPIRVVWEREVAPVLLASSKLNNWENFSPISMAIPKMSNLVLGDTTSDFVSVKRLLTISGEPLRGRCVPLDVDDIFAVPPARVEINGSFVMPTRLADVSLILESCPFADLGRTIPFFLVSVVPNEDVLQDFVNNMVKTIIIVVCSVGVCLLGIGAVLWLIFGKLNEVAEKMVGIAHTRDSSYVERLSRITEIRNVQSTFISLVERLRETELAKEKDAEYLAQLQYEAANRRLQSFDDLEENEMENGGSAGSSTTDDSSSFFSSADDEEVGGEDTLIGSLNLRMIVDKPNDYLYLAQKRMIGDGAASILSRSGTNAPSLADGVEYPPSLRGGYAASLANSHLRSPRGVGGSGSKGPASHASVVSSVAASASPSLGLIAGLVASAMDQGASFENRAQSNGTQQGTGISGAVRRRLENVFGVTESTVGLRARELSMRNFMNACLLGVGSGNTSSGFIETQVTCVRLTVVPFRPDPTLSAQQALVRMVSDALRVSTYSVVHQTAKFSTASIASSSRALPHSPQSSAVVADEDQCQCPSISPEGFIISADHTSVTVAFFPLHTLATVFPLHYDARARQGGGGGRVNAGNAGPARTGGTPYSLSTRGGGGLASGLDASSDLATRALQFALKVQSKASQSDSVVADYGVCYSTIDTDVKAVIDVSRAGLHANRLAEEVSRYEGIIANSRRAAAALQKRASSVACESRLDSSSRIRSKPSMAADAASASTTAGDMSTCRGNSTIKSSPESSEQQANVDSKKLETLAAQAAAASASIRRILAPPTSPPKFKGNAMLFTTATEVTQRLVSLQIQRLRCSFVITDRATALIPPLFLTYSAPVDCVEMCCCGIAALPSSASSSSPTPVSPSGASGGIIRGTRDARSGDGYGLLGGGDEMVVGGVPAVCGYSEQDIDGLKHDVEPALHRRLLNENPRRVADPSVTKCPDDHVNEQRATMRTTSRGHDTNNFAVSSDCPGEQRKKGAGASSNYSLSLASSLPFSAKGPHAEGQTGDRQIGGVRGKVAPSSVHSNTKRHVASDAGHNQQPKRSAATGVDHAAASSAAVGPMSDSARRSDSQKCPSTVASPAFGAPSFTNRGGGSVNINIAYGGDGLELMLRGVANSAGGESSARKGKAALSTSSFYLSGGEGGGETNGRFYRHVNNERGSDVKNIDNKYNTYNNNNNNDNEEASRSSRRLVAFARVLPSSSSDDECEKEAEGLPTEMLRDNDGIIGGGGGARKKAESRDKKQRLRQHTSSSLRATPTASGGGTAATGRPLSPPPCPILDELEQTLQLGGAPSAAANSAANAARFPTNCGGYVVVRCLVFEVNILSRHVPDTLLQHFQQGFRMLLTGNYSAASAFLEQLSANLVRLGNGIESGAIPVSVKVTGNAAVGARNPSGGPNARDREKNERERLRRGGESDGDTLGGSTSDDDSVLVLDGEASARAEALSDVAKLLSHVSRWKRIASANMSSRAPYLRREVNSWTTGRKAE